MSRFRLLSLPALDRSVPRRIAWRFCTLRLVVGVLLASEALSQPPSSDYRLQAGDEIEVSVWEEENLQRTVRIRPDGKFSFPLTGEVNAAGRTVGEIQMELSDRLERYIPEAVVTVSVTALEGNRIYVIGQVNTPGGFVMNPRLSVIQALSLAGGTTAFASVNDIIILRGRGQQQRVFRFAYDDIKRGRNLEQNVDLESGDVVIVP
jgi:polysaccharide export outer membrane protein